MHLLRIEPLMALLVLLTALETHGHGRLREPPSRSSMWRDGFDTIHNYNDNELNCGGAWNQNGVNGGKCGICGDPWQSKIRDNEAGGKYANGIITRTYMEGQVIGIAIEITAQHGGWFEFRICPNNDIDTPATPECLNQHVLPLADGTGNRVFMATNGPTGFHNTTLRLPSGLTCTQCVLQWKWHAGNSWGTNKDGTSCTGCGAQEEFYGCADVTITSSDLRRQEDSIEDLIQDEPIGDKTQAPFIPQEMSSATSHRVEPETSPVAMTTEPVSPRAATTDDCFAGPGYEGNAQMDRWCRVNCPLGNCPTHLCRCGPQTGPRRVCKTANVGPWKDADLDTWCARNCAAGFCPSTHCRCHTVTA